MLITTKLAAFGERSWRFWAQELENVWLFGNCTKSQTFSNSCAQNRHDLLAKIVWEVDGTKCGELWCWTLIFNVAKFCFCVGIHFRLQTTASRLKAQRPVQKLFLNFLCWPTCVVYLLSLKLTLTGDTNNFNAKKCSYDGKRTKLVDFTKCTYWTAYNFGFNFWSWFENKVRFHIVPPLREQYREVKFKINFTFEIRLVLGQVF